MTESLSQTIVCSVFSQVPSEETSTSNLQVSGECLLLYNVVYILKDSTESFSNTTTPNLHIVEGKKMSTALFTDLNCLTSPLLKMNSEPANPYDSIEFFDDFSFFHKSNLNPLSLGDESYQYTTEQEVPDNLNTRLYAAYNDSGVTSGAQSPCFECVSVFSEFKFIHTEATVESYIALPTFSSACVESLLPPTPTTDVNSNAGLVVSATTESNNNSRSRAKKQAVPVEKKDAKYLRRREKNTAAAKKNRLLTRHLEKQNEDALVQRLSEFDAEGDRLRADIDQLCHSRKLLFKLVQELHNDLIAQLI